MPINSVLEVPLGVARGIGRRYADWRNDGLRRYGAMKPESTPKEIAYNIDRDRHGYPVLWVPVQTGGETEGGETEFFLDKINVPYQVVPVSRDRKTGQTSPTGFEIRERLFRLAYDGRADMVLVVSIDDLLSTGTDMAIIYDKLDVLRPTGKIHDIKIAAVVDRVGAADPGYAVLRTMKPIFRDKDEMLAAYRGCASTDEFRDLVAARRGLHMPPRRRLIHRALQSSEAALKDFLGTMV